MANALQDKVVVVTGSTRGIGRSIAEACGAEGARVVVCARRETDVDAAITGLASSGVPVCGMVADVSVAEDIEALRDLALSWYGRIDCWVNNAGISLGYRPLDEIEPESLRSIVEVNLTGTILGCRAILPHFREHGGVLLNMAGRGYRGEATPYTAAYAATKTAVASLTRSLARENLKAPVSIDALVPGMVETDFYVDIDTSPRLAATAENWRYALDAFGVPLDEVGARTVPVLAQTPGAKTGRIHNLIGGPRMARGIAKMIWLRATGKMSAEE